MTTLFHRLRAHQSPGKWVERKNFFDPRALGLPPELRQLLPEPEPLLDGRMVVWGFVGRGECIYTYPLDDGQVERLYRPGAVVFDEASLKTLRGAGVTNDHPGEEENFAVIPENWARFGQGAVVGFGKAYAEHGLVAAPLALNSAEIIAAFQAGKHALSTGEMSLERVVPNGNVGGEPFDVIVDEIRYNHVALVDAGQAGPYARLRAHQLPYEIRTNADPSASGGPKMEFVEITINGVVYHVPKGQEEAYRARINSALQGRFEMGQASVQAALTEATGKATSLQAKLDETTEQRDELQTRVNSAGGEGEQGDEAFNTRVNEQVEARLETFRKALTLTGGKVRINHKDADGKDVEVNLAEVDDEAMMRAVILKLRPNAKLEGKDRGYLEVRMDMLIEHKETSDASEQVLNEASNQARIHARGGDGDESAAEKKLKEARTKRKAQLEGRKSA